MATDIKPCSLIPHCQVVPSALTDAPVPGPSYPAAAGMRKAECEAWRTLHHSMSYTNVRKGGIPKSKDRCACVTATGHKTGSG